MKYGPCCAIFVPTEWQMPRKALAKAMPAMVAAECTRSRASRSWGPLLQQQEKLGRVCDHKA